MNNEAALVAIVELITPIMSRAIAGELTASQALSAIAAEYQRQSGCSRDEAISFTNMVSGLLTGGMAR